LLYLGLVNSVQAASLAGFEAFKRLARLNLAGLLNLPLMVGGYWLGGLSGVLWGAVIARAAICLLCHRALRAEARLAGVPVSFDIRWDELPVMWRFSLPALLGSLLVSPVNWICSTMLVNTPGGYREVGIFNVANQWYNLILFVPLALAGGMLPVLSDRFGNDDLHSSRTVLRLMLKLNGAIAVAAIVILSALSPFIMAIYGQEYREGWPTLIVVVFTGAMFIILSPIGDVLAASSRMWLGCMMNFGWSIACIAMTFLLVGFGSLGLASARLLAYGLHAIWSFWVACVSLSSNYRTWPIESGA
jgi:O-antigen/teichoic acid export membrane protein